MLGDPSLNGNMLLGGVGTLKRKRQLRELVEKHNKDHNDDLFDSTPFKKRAKRTSVRVFCFVDFIYLQLPLCLAARVYQSDFSSRLLNIYTQYICSVFLQPVINDESDAEFFHSQDYRYLTPGVKTPGDWFPPSYGKKTPGNVFSPGLLSTVDR